MIPLIAQKTRYCSVLQGELPDGCKGCVKGEKLVLFITGMCPATCFFCPLSEEKKNKDVIFANELELKGTDDEKINAMIAEAKANRATGAGITGGDPLCKVQRTCAFIRALKKEFGKKFHVHLYTPLILVNEMTLKALFDSGLDEIRFHPSLQSEKFWGRMKLAQVYPWNVGIEIPVFPDKIEETKRLITYAADNSLIDFLNLNELEISERTTEVFNARGYVIKNKTSYAIRGSKDAALELMKHARDFGLTAHFCTTRLKDRVQMGNRILKRAQEEAKPFDIVDDEGMLTRGAIYLHYAPEYGYTKKMRSLSIEECEQEIIQLADVYAWLRLCGMPADAGMIDKERLRIILGAKILRAMNKLLKKKFKNAATAIITEYPTSDAFIVELEVL